MKTITLDEPGRFTQGDTEDPARPAAGEALVQVHRVGICGTDLHAFRGRQPFFSYPRILGHELGVEVLEAPGGELSPGDLCTIEPYLNCGTCHACRRGKTNCCESLQVLGVHTDGGMRERIVVPASKLYRSAELSLDQLALVETLGIGSHAVDRSTIEAGERVLVIGAGPIGLSALQFAQIAGADVAVLELSASRRDFCREQFGVKHCIDGSDEPVEQLRAAFDGDLPTAVLDATGNPNSMMGAFQFVASGGRLTYIGLVQSDLSFHDPEFHRKEITLLATRNALPKDFRNIVELMETGRIDTTPWISHRANYDEFVDHFPGWLEPDRGVVKAMLEL